MDIYTHDYTKASEAEADISWLIRNYDPMCERTMKEVLVSALTHLREYLAADNMVVDNDCYGFIKQSDTFDEDQMVFIRDIFAERLHETTGHSRTFDDMLGIINVVQRATGCDEYASVDEFRADKSGSFVERT